MKSKLFGIILIVTIIAIVTISLIADNNMVAKIAIVVLATFKLILDIVSFVGINKRHKTK